MDDARTNADVGKHYQTGQDRVNQGHDAEGLRE